MSRKSPLPFVRVVLVGCGERETREAHRQSATGSGVRHEQSSSIGFLSWRITRERYLGALGLDLYPALARLPSALSRDELSCLRQRNIIIIEEFARGAAHHTLCVPGRIANPADGIVCTACGKKLPYNNNGFQKSRQRVCPTRTEGRRHRQQG